MSSIEQAESTQRFPEVANHGSHRNQLRRALTWLLLAATALLGTAAFASTSLWKISRGDQTLYLGGTIHVLRSADYPLPDEFSRAFDRANRLVLETDLNQIDDASFREAFLAAARYPEGQTLADHLSAEVLSRLGTVCQDSGVDVATLLPFRPSVAMLTLLSLELSRLQITQVGVDQYFYQRAIDAGKPIAGLETANQQLDFLATMGRGVENQFVLHSLQDLDQLAVMLDEMIAHWRAGDTHKLEQLFVVPLQREHPAIYQSLLVQRNEAWLSQLEQLLQTEETELVLVGVAHLLGADGLLQQLQGLGFTVEQW